MWMAGGHGLVGGSDEVGRGSLGGPVSAGVVVVDDSTKRPPAGLRDSKLLTPSARQALVPRIEQWARAWGVGHASAAEIDSVGLLRALRLAGERAMAQLAHFPGVVVLDGNYDWYRRPAPVPQSRPAVEPPHVELRIKADLTCASVAAASVLAKVKRDRLMEELAVEYPDYGWATNKGYATRFHLVALRELGPSLQHRRSWRLPRRGEALPEGELADDVIDLDRYANQGLA